MKAWYAVHTYSGHENKVKTNIERRAASLRLQDRIGRILVPVEEETRNRNGRRATIKRKVFPGYVLIEMELDDQTWYLVKNTIGVTGFVSSGNKPVPLQNHEIEGILAAVSGEGAMKKTRPAWQKAEVVRVTSGPFADFNGSIEDVNEDKQKVRVLISIFGRDTPVELDFNQIERV
ncbi:MAG: transcription termination/antitermination factor NusG [Armatimonadetes bacterium]|nr:transcription termination/antitermination factor NusG [Armatimonadota bacterium]